MTEAWPTTLGDALKLELSAIFPDYAKLLASTADRRDLDWKLCSRGLLPEADLLKTYAKCTGLPVPETDELELDGIEVFAEISRDYIEKCCCVPYKWDSTTATILVADPYALDEIRYMFRVFYDLNTEFLLVRRSEV